MVRTGIVGHQAADPVVPETLDIASRGVQVWQGDGIISQPAILDLGLIIVVIDQTVGMEILLRVERVEDTVVD